MELKKWESFESNELKGDWIRVFLFADRFTQIWIKMHIIYHKNILKQNCLNHEYFLFHLFFFFFDIFVSDNNNIVFYWQL